MKKIYSLLTLCAALGWHTTPAQNWRPFRPNGDVHAFRGASPDSVLTMRLDSAALQGADSVYYFNRTMRRAGNNYQWRKSVNNQFGKVLRYNPAERTYVLQWSEPSVNGFSLDRLLVLKPFAKVGANWSSAFTDYGVQTTLLAKGAGLVDGVTDSVATFRLSTGATVVLSKNHGLVSAPANLLFGVPNPKILTLARRPAPAGQSYYNPLALLDLQPGDELGYKQEAFSFGPFPCYTGWVLRQVMSRQVTADSIVYTMREQRRMSYSSAPGCSGGAPTMTPVAMLRMAASLRTGQWAAKGAGVLVPADAELLSYAYRPAYAGATNVVVMGSPVVTGQAASACGTPLLSQRRLYRSGATADYNSGLDALAWEQTVSLGTGVTGQGEYSLSYARRTVNGAPQTCGSRNEFSTLLPNSQAAQVAPLQLYPNPAAESVVLVLPEASRTVATVRILDGLGRAVSTQPLAAGQTSTVLNLRNLAGGSYVVEVQAAGEAPRHIRLQH
ncbi:T9SS type A sorting domain-containing protein [Hymenobacter aquaticus]|uniref:T9SS type A sorting domain-containing protein n=1 Tax=Hymenobacter aquaticus TaxID=1867101 RepID=A0A4Z0Q6G3_9BACT|nr:T9SS type A sorting domain-containing protein [Hymenobacter aquaticus]TGE25678.1 T9SS type A sorting domain-containing protein [Hymenobacter aquaticus]